MTVSPNAIGDTILWIVTSSAGNATAPTSSGGESITCSANHILTSNQTHVCSYVANTTSSETVSNNSSVSSFWNAGVLYDLQCASTCVIEQGPIYADTSGTGSAGTATAGSITTSHQLNELILGGFTGNNITVSLMTAVSPYVIPGTASCTSGAGCGQARGAGGAQAALENQTSSNVGTFTASVTMPALPSTVGMTLSVY